MDIWHPISKGSLRHICHRFHQYKQSPLHTFCTFPRCYAKKRKSALQLHPPEVPPLPTFLNLHGASLYQRVPQLLILLPFWLRHFHLQGRARATTATCFYCVLFLWQTHFWRRAAPPGRPVRSRNIRATNLWILIILLLRGVALVGLGWHWSTSLSIRC